VSPEFRARLTLGDLSLLRRHTGQTWPVSEVLSLPSPCVVVLIGPGASGKSTWAAANFPADTIVSSDRLRALVGMAEDDVSASADALALLDEIVRQRIGRRLTTVIDTLGLDAGRREAWLSLGRAHKMPVAAVAFDTSPEECKARNRSRAKRIPATVLAGQLRSWPAVRDGLGNEGFDVVLAPQPVRVVPDVFVAATPALQRQQEQPTGLRFGLHVGEFTTPDGTTTAAWLRAVASGAEAAGFDAIYVMDHFRQIPQIGRSWEDFLESYTTLAYLAACTERVRLGALVTGITYRNVPHLGKIIATLDVLSGGRVTCGLGLAWYGEEHAAYGWPFPSTSQRYALLEDALQLLPLMWGPGSPAFTGQVLEVPEAVCYPRPLQEHVPVVVGGGGERRTLRLAAQYADAANVFGDATTVRHKADVLRAHCADVGREPADVAVTHLSTALIGTDDQHVAQLVEARRPRRRSPAWYAASVNAGTVGDQIGRFRELAEAGAQEVMIRLPDLADPTALDRVARVIAAFR
jgi:F420-dependent oxidoreductase-like protein